MGIGVLFWVFNVPPRYAKIAVKRGPMKEELEQFMRRSRRRDRDDETRSPTDTGVEAMANQKRGGAPI